MPSGKPTRCNVPTKGLQACVVAGCKDVHGSWISDCLCPLQELWPFWREIQRLYKAHALLWPGDDPNFPYGFFTRSWAGRGRAYRMLAEPVDIANWCANLRCPAEPPYYAKRYGLPLVPSALRSRMHCDA